jgi:predicted MPP superfamily phosphohydrolase
MLPVENKAYSAGEVDLKDGRTLYINRALGHLWQIRFNVRPEITVFELSHA